MLFLVFAHGHMSRLIQQYVCSLQDGVCEQSDAGAFAILARFILELSHPVQPPHARSAGEQPLKLGMGGHLRLIEQDRLVGIKTARKQRSGHFARICSQFAWHVRHRNGVQVSQKIQALHLVLHFDPVADCPQIIAQMKIASWLNARNDAHVCYSLMGAAGVTARRRRRDFSS